MNSYFELLKVVETLGRLLFNVKNDDVWKKRFNHLCSNIYKLVIVTLKKKIIILYKTKKNCSKTYHFHHKQKHKC